MAGLTADDAESEEVGEGGAAIGGGGIRGAAICSACTGPGAASGSATFITAPRRLREEQCHATVSEAAEGQDGSDGERKESEGRGRYSEACACSAPRLGQHETDGRNVNVMALLRPLSWFG